jgi:hypothetical protein
MGLFLRITSSVILVGLSACGSSAETKESSSLGSEANSVAKAQQLVDCQGKPSKIKWDEGRYAEICQDGFRKWRIGDESDFEPVATKSAQPNYKNFCASVKKLKSRNAAEIKSRSYLFESLTEEAKDRVPQVLKDFEGPAADARIKSQLDRILGELESCPAQFAKMKIDEEDEANTRSRGLSRGQYGGRESFN